MKEINTNNNQNESEFTHFPKELEIFLKKVERFKMEMNRIEQHNSDLQMKTEDIISHFHEKKNKDHFESLFF